MITCAVLLGSFHGVAHCAREEKIHRVEVHVSFYCYRVNGSRPPEILLLKRSDNRQIAPGKWESGGGQVRDNESFEAAAKRQLLEETGLCASHWRPMDCYEIALGDGALIPGLSFSCRAYPGFDVKIDPREHSQYRWATLDDLFEVDFVDPGMRQIITRLIIGQSRHW
jgi:8-oxo-dGTP pyrophosphatase MutT (NUDIX family)